jgi:hypothetical protein
MDGADMLVVYSLFCLGWALIQIAYERSPASSDGATDWSSKVFLSPLWMSSPVSRLIVGLLALASSIVVPVVGWVALRWWYGLLGFLFVKGIAPAFVPGRELLLTGVYRWWNPGTWNPGITFLLGVFLTSLSTILMFL